MADNLSTLGTRQIENALRRGAKTALVTGGIQPSTRRGNKELDLAVQRLAQQTYSSLEEAAQTGAALGKKIVELSQAKGKTDLDGGIVRQMMLTGEIPTVVKVTAKPAKTTPVVVDTAPRAAEPAPAKPAEEEVHQEDTEVEVPSAEAIAAIEAEELDIPDVDIMTDEADAVTADIDVATDDVVVTDDIDGVEAIETVDPEMADAPDLDPIETLKPADIDAPAPEPLTAADTAAVEASAEAVGAEPEAVDKIQ